MTTHTQLLAQLVGLEDRIMQRFTLLTTRITTMATKEDVQAAVAALQAEIAATKTALQQAIDTEQGEVAAVIAGLNQQIVILQQQIAQGGVDAAFLQATADALGAMRTQLAAAGAALVTDVTGTIGTDPGAASGGSTTGDGSTITSGTEG